MWRRNIRKGVDYVALQETNIRRENNRLTQAKFVDTLVTK